MTKFDRFGIITGGEVTLDVGGSRINISPYQLMLENGDLAGSGAPIGAPAKSIEVNFVTGPTQPLQERLEFQPPEYAVNINVSTPGQLHIYYDHVGADIALSTAINRPGPTFIQFQKIVWSAGANSVADLSIETLPAFNDFRNESYIGITVDPETAKQDWYDGQIFTAGNYNRPLVAHGIQSKVLQGESLINFGGNYFVTFAIPSDIEMTGTPVPGTTEVKLKPIENLARAGGSYVTYPTKANPDLGGGTYAMIETGLGTFNDFLNKTVYILIEKETGIPSASFIYNSSTHYLVAFAEVPGTATDLSTIEFEIVNELGGQGALINTLATLLSAQRPSGFLKPLEIREIPADNQILMKANTLLIDGFVVEIPDITIQLSAPPDFGLGEIYRQDFVYIEISKETAPQTILSYEIKVLDDVDFENYPDSFLEVNVGNPSGFNIENSENNNFTYQSEGHYRADDPTNEVDGYTFALPIAMIHRFNNGAFALSNRNGGSYPTRPDGRRDTRINLKEVEVMAPDTHPVDKPGETVKTIIRILKGTHNVRLGPTFLDPKIFSRSPLQEDRLGGVPGIGYTKIGDIDGIRYLWSNDKTIKPKMFFIFRADLDSGDSAPYNTFPCYSYDAAPARLLTLRVPTGTDAEIHLDPATAQPIGFQAFWVTTGEPVVFTGLWTIGGGFTVITNNLDPTDPNYQATGEIAVMYELDHTCEFDEVGLTKVPTEVFGVANSGNYSIYNSTFAPALDTYINPKFISNLTGPPVGGTNPQTSPKTIDSVNYSDKLYLERVGNTHKFNTYELHYNIAGGSSTFDVNDVLTYNFGTAGFADYKVTGIKRAYNGTTGDELNIIGVTWDSNEHSGSAEFHITLDSSVPMSDSAVFVLGIGSASNLSDTQPKQMDLDIASLAISNLVQTDVITFVGDGSTGEFRYSDGRIVYGISSAKLKPGTGPANNIHVAYMGPGPSPYPALPMQVTGLGSNYLVFDLTQNSNPGGWVESPPASGNFVPPVGASIRIPILESYLTTEPIHLQYEYNNLPFKKFLPVSGDRDYNDSISESQLPYEPGQSAEVIARGMLMITNDGIANGRGSVYSPASERVPVVQGITKVGVDTRTSHVGLNDVLLYQTQKEAFAEGAIINFDSDYVLTVDAVETTTLIGWFALVKQLHAVTLFLYTARKTFGALVLDEPEQAFVCELSSNKREF